MQRAMSHAALMLMTALAASCASEEENLSLSSSCRDAATHSDLTWIQDNILTPSCAAFAACHRDAATSAAGLNLEPGQARANLVGKSSVLFPSYQLVAAGIPSSSYLMIITGQVNGPLPTGVGTMPFNSPLLCEEKRAAMQRWIAAGALP
jgi:hypothetical protein